MCGIAGFNGQGDRALLTRMLRIIKHRGPDAEGIYEAASAGIGLGHVRLSIIDLSEKSNQPLWDATNQICVVFNGEIYNYRELRGELTRKGYCFKSEGDAEVIVNLYLEAGASAFKRLNGIFAFALYDTRDRTLRLVRDQFGIKPLYYAETAQSLFFASEIKAILQSPDVSRALSIPALQSALGLLWIPGPRTTLVGVEKVMPGEMLVIKDGRIKSRCELIGLPFDQPITNVPEDEAIAAVRDAVALAVERQLISDVEIGAFLSGGLDSTAVVAMAARHAGQKKLRCFSIESSGGVDASTIDDLPYAKSAAQALGVSLDIIRISSTMFEDLAKMVWHLDEPQADPAPLNVWYIARGAHEAGLKVLLSGGGGDDVFSGYRRHVALQMESLWAWMPHFMRYGLKAGGALVDRAFGLRRAEKLFRHATQDANGRLAGYFLWLEQSEIYHLLSGDSKHKLHAQLNGRGDAPHQPLLDMLGSLPTDMPVLNKMLALEQRFFLPDHNCNYTDKMSMATGVETRVPLLDPDLVALAARLPVRYKQRGLEGKWIFKKAMEGIVPSANIWRPKTGFGAPVRRWIRHDLKPMVDDLLAPSRIKSRGLWDATAVATLIHKDRAGTIDASYTILSLLAIELWCRQFIDPSLPRAI